ncbi:unnamed protein product [Nezara viridula]|uniref:CHK kinase-like domain-containing protein n=1 Tax=Nezara viridula TaxID=85310 RepID=A0A9P0E9E7_NEZVI|nr:unnamed protein product [Nezara viridula]
MDKEIFEVVLNKSAQDSKIKRIIEMKSESALPTGENFTSTILKITLKVVLGNGRIATKTFIAKKGYTGEAAEQPRKENSLFRTEVSVYTNVLREMGYLMEEFGDTEGPLWCEFIHYNRANSIIILEDLKASGFNTVKRTEPQDLDHARLTLRSLGRYHAMAKVLEERGLISKDGYKPHPFLGDGIYIRNFLYGSLQTLFKGMRKSWGEEWAEYADKLSQMSCEELSKRITESGNFDDNTFKCLNHGDCWSNNMMFKHNWEGKPIEMRFVDFQIPHYNSPCVDVTSYIYSSVKASVRHQNLKSLIELYHESLTSSLDRFGYKGSKPSLEDINNAMERLLFFGTCFFTACVPCALTERTDALDLDKIFKTNGEEGYNLSVYCEDGVVETIGEDLKALVKLFEKR